MSPRQTLECTGSTWCLLDFSIALPSSPFTSQLLSSTSWLQEGMAPPSFPYFRAREFPGGGGELKTGSGQVAGEQEGKWAFDLLLVGQR